MVGLKGNPLSDLSRGTHLSTLRNRGVTVEFDDHRPATSAVSGPAVNIFTPPLRAEIERILDLVPGDALTMETMTALTRLTAGGTNISDLTGLEFATNLTHLELYDSNISDLSPLKELTKLRVLYLYPNNISDISALGNCECVEWDWAIYRRWLRGDGGTISLEGNPLSAESRGSHIPALQNKGVMVHY